MSLIRVECVGCSTFLQVRAELAGQQGKCPKCGRLIAIPAASAVDGGAGGGRESVATGDSPPALGAQSPLTRDPLDTAAAPRPPMVLAQATGPEMLAEIQRRGKSAVMVVFETPTDGSYEVGHRAEANVRCYRTSDMSDAQLMQVLHQLGQMSEGSRNQKGGIGLQPEGPLPFELKGDRLGMTLAEFKTKYARQAGGMTMPYCSDGCAGQANPTLWAEPWQVAAGLVNGRVDLPSEGNPPTIAGVRTELFLYHFVDDRLYKMTALFDTEAFHLIHSALMQKQGPPTRENKEHTELTWGNGVSTIKLVRGAIRPKKFSTLLFIHDALQKSAEGRAPRREADL